MGPTLSPGGLSNRSRGSAVSRTLASQQPLSTKACPSPYHLVGRLKHSFHVFTVVGEMLGDDLEGST